MKTIKLGRRWFQFTLRGLFGLTVVTCIFGAWLARERQLVCDQLAAAENVRRLGGIAMCCPSYASDDERPSFRNRLRNALVREPIKNINYVSVEGTEISDQEIAHLSALPKLRALTVVGSSVTDDVMKTVESLRSLQSLSFVDANISDRSLSRLGNLTQLEQLDLSGTRITDAGLEHLRGLTRLRRLKLQRTKVTDVGAARLLEFLPEVKVLL